MQIDIKCRFTGRVLFSRTAEGNTIKATVEAAVEARAHLAGAYLADAYLAGAKWRDGITLTRAPLQLYGLRYPVTILDAHMQIGCKLYSLTEWAAFADADIAAMDGKTALTFWRAHKAGILALAASDGRGAETVAREAA